MADSVVDQVLDECSQFRVLVVGSSRGKAQLIREIFGTSRLTRYPADFSRDEEIYSKENEYFIAHVFDDWTGVADVLARRRRGEPDEVIHCIWHYIDAQEATEVTGDDKGNQLCPDSVRHLGIPVITIFGRFDNIVSRSIEIGSKRRQDQALTDTDKADAAQIRRVVDTIGLYLLQFPDTVAITSKTPASKLTFLNIVLAALDKRKDLQTLLIIAQRLNPSLKFETSLNLAMKQFLLGTVSTASPLPIPFAGTIGEYTATYLIKQDILRIWNIHDPDFLCSNAQGEASMMDNLLKVPTWGIKRVVYSLPVIAQIKGVWETPKMAKSLGALMIDLTLLMERAFLATMSGSADGSSPARTPAKLAQIAAMSPKTPLRPIQRSQYGKDGVKSPVSAEVLRQRQQLYSPLNGNAISSPKTPSNLRSGMDNLIDLDSDSRPATPPRPSSAQKVNSGQAKPALPPKPPPKPSRPLTPQAQTSTPQAPKAVGFQALELSTPTSSSVVDVAIRPSSLPLTRRMLEGIMAEYKPVQAAVDEELSEFFNQEGEGLQRSFQKDTVRRKLDSIVRKWRLSEVVTM